MDVTASELSTAEVSAVLSSIRVFAQEHIESTSNSATGNIVIFIYIPFHNRVNRSVIKILSPYHI